MKKKCRSVKNLILPYARGELDEPDARAVESHIDECRGCARELEGFIRLDEGLDLLRRGEEPEGLWNGYWEEIKSSLEPRPQPLPWRGWRTLRLAAAAATVIIALALLIRPGGRDVPESPKVKWSIPRSTRTMRGKPRFSQALRDKSGEKYCKVLSVRAGNPDANLMIYQVDESRLTVIWLMEPPREDKSSGLKNEKTVTA